MPGEYKTDGRHLNQDMETSGEFISLFISVGTTQVCIFVVFEVILEIGYKLWSKTKQNLSTLIFMSDF